MEKLQQLLQSAVEDAVVGEPLRAGLAGRARTAAQGVLMRQGIRNARIHARQHGGGIVVEIAIPAGPARVQRIVVGVGLA